MNRAVKRVYDFMIGGYIDKVQNNTVVMQNDRIFERLYILPGEDKHGSAYIDFIADYVTTQYFDYEQ